MTGIDYGSSAIPPPNFCQVIPCECGAENACLCGRCHGCGKQRFPPHESLRKDVQCVSDCKEAQLFERNHGSIAFLKICLSAVNKLLVKKAVASEEELHQALDEEITSVSEKKA